MVFDALFGWLGQAIYFELEQLKAEIDEGIEVPGKSTI